LSVDDEEADDKGSHANSRPNELRCEGDFEVIRKPKDKKISIFQMSRRICRTQKYGSLADLISLGGSIRKM
jgi:hypothetical protein